MPQKILLTSFQTWLPHQVSNSSDDLLGEISQIEKLSPQLIFLRKLPVNVSEASSRVIAKIKQLQTKAIICCGMAENRTKLTVESCATCGETLIKTSVNLEQVVTKLTECEISHDAGKFVCEGLYYEVLKYLQDHKNNTPCIFVHVPVLTPDNTPSIVADFRLIIQRVS
jgi:pyroglutamyl-peptidase